MAARRPAYHKSSIRFWLISILVVSVFALYFFRAAWLPAIGWYLVRTDPPEKADAIVVLAGDFTGGRIRKAAELAQQGYAPKVLVSGPDGVYGGHESDLAVAYAVKIGFPEALFERVPHQARSTKEEAQFFIPLLRSKGIKHYILVTSNFHTRRAGKLFRDEGKDLRVTVIAAPDPNFRPDAWWTNRESQKTTWYEWQKALTGPLGL